MGRPSGARQSAQIKKVSLLHMFHQLHFDCHKLWGGGGGGINPFTATGRDRGPIIYIW